QWHARGATASDLRWKQVPILLKKATEAPRNTEAWTLHRDRALVSRKLLEELGEGPSPVQLIVLKGNVVEGLRTATRLNPTSASLHAQLAEASAAMGLLSDAAIEAEAALRLDGLTPHADRKLPATRKKRLETELPAWQKAPPPPIAGPGGPQ